MAVLAEHGIKLRFHENHTRSPQNSWHITPGRAAGEVGLTALLHVDTMTKRDAIFDILGNNSGIQTGGRPVTIEVEDLSGRATRKNKTKTNKTNRGAPEEAEGLLSGATPLIPSTLKREWDCVSTPPVCSGPRPYGDGYFISIRLAHISHKDVLQSLPPKKRKYSQQSNGPSKQLLHSQG